MTDWSYMQILVDFFNFKYRNVSKRIINKKFICLYLFEVKTHNLKINNEEIRIVLERS